MGVELSLLGPVQNEGHMDNVDLNGECNKRNQIPTGQQWSSWNSLPHWKKHGLLTAESSREVVKPPYTVTTTVSSTSLTHWVEWPWRLNMPPSTKTFPQMALFSLIVNSQQSSRAVLSRKLNPPISNSWISWLSHSTVLIVWEVLAFGHIEEDGKIWVHTYPLHQVWQDKKEKKKKKAVHQLRPTFFS
jgi:hypothetical protein